MTAIPYNQIVDAHSLIADGEVFLYEISPVSGGTLYLKSGPEYTYLNRKYESIPITITGERFSADTSTPTPRMTIGQEQVNLLPFKGLIHEGYLEAARIVRHKVLLDDMLSQTNAKKTSYFRVKRVEDYTSTKISLLLSTLSGASNQSYPFRQYTPPAFPWVDLS